MKKFLVFLVIFAIGLFYFLNQQKEKKLEEDYAKIEQVKTACEEFVKSGEMFLLGSNQTTWYVFDLNDIHESEEAPYKKLEVLLGEDFVANISNGEHIYVGILPYQSSYRIYIGEASDPYMVYPDWNYEELETKS